jgi:hypothetical protein
MFATGRFLLLLIVAAVSATTLSGCGAANKKDSHVFNGHGVFFRYPNGWRQIEPKGLSKRGLWTAMVEPSNSSGADIAFLTEYRNPRAVTKKNLAAQAPGITSIVAGVARQAGGALLSGPTPTTMGGLPGYGFRISAVASEKRPSSSRLVLVWKGKAEYFLNCQYLTKGVLGGEIERGCKTIITSFRLS